MTEPRKPGRPKGTARKEPTKVIRVPISKLDAVLALLKDPPPGCVGMPNGGVDKISG
jgi:hypothetical protein